MDNSETILCACGDHRPRDQMYVTSGEFGPACIDCCISDGLDIDQLQTVAEYELTEG